MNEKEQEIKALMEEGKSVKEIAEALEVTRGSVYQSVKRMRDSGIKLPKSTATRGRPPKAISEPASLNGALSVEEHVQSELSTIATRKEQVATQIAELQAEQEALNGREALLAKAREALVIA